MTEQEVRTLKIEYEIKFDFHVKNLENKGAPQVNVETAEQFKKIVKYNTIFYFERAIRPCVSFFQVYCSMIDGFLIVYEKAYMIKGCIYDKKEKDLLFFN